jgi:hypothetical protein
VYLLRTAVLQQHVVPNAKIPTVLLPVAEPQVDACVADPPKATVHPEYVYLFRVETTQKLLTVPNAKMPTVLLPAAEPLLDAEVAAPPALTTSPEYVYLLRVVDELGFAPNAKIPTVLLPAAEP